MIQSRALTGRLVFWQKHGRQATARGSAGGERVATIIVLRFLDGWLPTGLAFDKLADTDTTVSALGRLL